MLKYSIYSLAKETKRELINELKRIPLLELIMKKLVRVLQKNVFMKKSKRRKIFHNCSDLSKIRCSSMLSLV
jgi:hypothetical protein